MASQESSHRVLVMQMLHNSGLYPIHRRSAVCSCSSAECTLCLCGRKCDLPLGLMTLLWMRLSPTTEEASPELYLHSIGTSR